VTTGLLGFILLGAVLVKLGRRLNGLRGKRLQKTTRGGLLLRRHSAMYAILVRKENQGYSQSSGNTELSIITTEQSVKSDY
jgi:hypothetical protein